MGGLYSRLKKHYSTKIDCGYLNPQGLYNNRCFDLKIVRGLIYKRKLAPFYKGASEISINKKISFEIECPICFLFYPSNMNQTRCCHKHICTECFLQLRTVCPFCVQPDLGIIYSAPKHNSLCDLNRQESKVMNDSNVVLLADIIIKSDTTSAIGSTRRRRVRLSSSRIVDETIYDTTAQLNIEDVLIMEAIRLSLNDT